MSYKEEEWVNYLKKQAERYQETVNNLEDKVTKKEEECTNLNHKKADLEYEVTKLSKELEEIAQQRKDAAKAFEQEQLERARAKARDITNEELLQIFQEYTKEIDEKLKALRSQENNLNNRYRIVEENEAQVKEQQEQLKNQKEQFAKSSAQKEEELKKKEEELHNREKQVQEQASANKSLEAELNNKAIKQGEFYELLQKKEDLVNTREKNVEGREKNVAKEEEKVKGAKAEIDKKNNEFKKLNNKIIWLREELAKSKVNTETLKRENNGLKDTVQKQAKIIEVDETIINKLSEKINNLIGIIGTVKENISKSVQEWNNTRIKLAELSKRLEVQENENFFQRAANKIRGIFKKTQALPAPSTVLKSNINDFYSPGYQAMNSAENAERTIADYNLPNQVNEINNILRDRQSMIDKNDRSNSTSNRETLSQAELKRMLQNQQEKADKGSIQPQQKIKNSNSIGNSPIPASYAPGSRYAQPITRNTGKHSNTLGSNLGSGRKTIEVAFDRDDSLEL